MSSGARDSWSHRAVALCTTFVINVVTSQATHKYNTVEWTVYTTIAESGSPLFLGRKINLHPPALNVNHSTCRECLVVAYLIMMTKPSDYTATVIIRY